MGGRSGGAGRRGRRLRPMAMFQRPGGGSGASRMGTIASVEDWGGRAYRYLEIGSANTPTAIRGEGSISAWESKAGYGGYKDPYLTVSVTRRLPEADRGKGIGKGMYLAGLKYAQDNNLGFRSDSSVSTAARVVWNSLAARGVEMTKSRRSADFKFTISPEAVQNVDIDALNRQRKTG